MSQTRRSCSALEIDIELRDVWELLDQRPDMWDDLHLAVTASAMRVAYDRGRRQGEAEGKVAGCEERYEERYYEDYEEGYQEGYEHGYDDGKDSALADAAR